MDPISETKSILKDHYNSDKLLCHLCDLTTLMLDSFILAFIQFCVEQVEFLNLRHYLKNMK